MPIKSELLLEAILENISRIKSCFFNMKNEPFNNDRFLPIEHFNDDTEFIGISIWDNQLEKLHGPFTFKQKNSPGDLLIIDAYKWAANILYIYFVGGAENDHCIMGLLNGKAEIEDC